MMNRPLHGDDHLRADLRRKLSRLKTSPQGKKGVSRRSAAFNIHKEGAGQIAVIVPTNVGKSALVAALTHADPEVSPTPYTTWHPAHGMMQIDNFPGYSWWIPHTLTAISSNPN
jgi:ribosome-interacting GTPase 1